MSRLPARSAGVLEQTVGDEVVVIAPADGMAYSLSGLHARVWAATADDRRSSAPQDADGGLADAVTDLTSLGLLVAPSGVSRRTALRTGGFIAAGGVLALALPAVDAAASGAIPPAALTFSCKDYPATVHSPPATRQTLTVGASTTTRTITFSLTSAGGGGGGAAGATGSAEQTNPGNGGNGGFVTGTIILPKGGPDTISVYVGCGSTSEIINPTTSPAAFQDGGAGQGPGGYGGGGSFYASGPGGAPTGLVGSAGGGGGASAIVFSGDTASPSIIAGGGGGGGPAGTAGLLGQTTQPNGGKGAGAGAGTTVAGTAGTGGLAAGGLGTGGGAGGTAAGGAAGAENGDNIYAPDTAGGGPALAGGTGGQGGVAYSSNGTLFGAGGGGGGGYTAGGGGGTNVNTTLGTVINGAGGGGSGRTASTATSNSGAATITVVTSGTVGGAAGSVGVGGAAVAARTSAPMGPGSVGSAGQVSFSSPGGFTISAS